MSHPESSERPYQEPTSEALQKMDELLDVYGKTLRDIEEQGPSKLLLAQRELLKTRLQELRANELPIRPETDPKFRAEVKEILAEAYEQGRITSDVLREAEIEGKQATEEWIRGSRGKQAPSPIEANEAVLDDVVDSLDEEALPEVTETNPLELAKTITSHHLRIEKILYDMESDVMREHMDIDLTLSHFSDDELEQLKFVDDAYNSYEDKMEKVFRGLSNSDKHAGWDLAIPESMMSIPVEDLKDIVFAIRQQEAKFLSKQREYRINHPHRE